eukprot:1443223-Pleurochrysis_carterae.AAC.5
MRQKGPNTCNILMSTSIGYIYDGQQKVCKFASPITPHQQLQILGNKVWYSWPRPKYYNTRAAQRDRTDDSAADSRADEGRSE